MLSPSEAWPIVQEAILVFRANVPDMAKARQALRNVLSTGAWRSYDSPTGAKCSYEDFTTWVAAPVPLGLHTTLDNLQQIAKGDPGLTDALDEALAEQYPQGVHHDSYNITLSRGTAQRQALRRLRKDRPDLHARVLLSKGDPNRLSAHAAMIEAGFRHPTLTVRADDPEHAAQMLRQHFSKDPEQFALFMKHLQEKKEN